jgi:hypothetical protein
LVGAAAAGGALVAAGGAAAGCEHAESTIARAPADETS